VAERVGVLLGDGEYLGALEALAGIAGTVKSVVHLDRLQG